MIKFLKERKEIKAAKIAEAEALRLEAIRKQSLEDRKKMEEQRAELLKKKEEEDAAALQACKEKWRKIQLAEFERQGVPVPSWVKQ